MALAVPDLYDYCEAHGLPYAFGYATNAVLQRATEQALADLELYHHFYRHREPAVQRFESVADLFAVFSRLLAIYRLTAFSLAQSAH